MNAEGVTSSRRAHCGVMIDRQGSHPLEGISRDPGA